MDAEADLLRRIGEDFASIYYATLSRCPRRLTRFYGEHSMLVHGVSGTDIRTAVGQKDVRDCVVRLQQQQQQWRGGREAVARTLTVTAQRVLDYVVVGVTGEMRLLQQQTDERRRRRFTQTMVLGGGGGGGGDHRGRSGYECAIRNDMFFYVDDGDAKPLQDDCSWVAKERNQTRNKVSDGSPPPRRYQSGGSYRHRLPRYPPASHQIFVSGIPGSVRPQTLTRFFGRYGELHSLRVMRKNVNYGFVTFLDAESARAVLRNRPILFPGDGDDDDDAVWLVVKRKKTAQGHGDRENAYLDHQLFVGDVPDRVTSDDLKRFFEKWGDVVNARIVVVRETDKESNEEETVHGFVTFKTENSAKAILEDRPIVFADENGPPVELTITEKFRRTFVRNSSNRHFVREKLKREREREQ